MNAEQLAELRENERPVLIGLGAIGSWVARWLIANGFQFTGYDRDTVSLKNLAAGAFEQSDVGRRKAHAFPTHCAVARWEPYEGFGSRTSVFVCADHGPTRRDAAQLAEATNRRFFCAKANGNQWQVWHVGRGESPLDFMAFDEAAEANPVTVPCGDPSVGRTASLGAAAELLSIWSGHTITPEEVEASYGVKFDPALAHVIQQRWNDSRQQHEEGARLQVEQQIKEEIDRRRTESDEWALLDLKKIREDRKKRKSRPRLTIHQRAIYLRYESSDNNTIQFSAQIAVSKKFYLERLVLAESRITADRTAEDLCLPETIELEELLA